MVRVSFYRILSFFWVLAKSANPLKYRACQQNQRFGPSRCGSSRSCVVTSKNNENLTGLEALGHQVGPGTAVSGPLGRQVGSAMAVLGTLGRQVGSGTTVSRPLDVSDAPDGFRLTVRMGQTAWILQLHLQKLCFVLLHLVGTQLAVEWSLKRRFGSFGHSSWLWNAVQGHNWQSSWPWNGGFESPGTSR